MDHAMVKAVPEVKPPEQPLLGLFLFTEK